MTEGRRGDPAELVLEQQFTAAARALTAHDDGVERTVVEPPQQHAGEIDPHVEMQAWVERIHPRHQVGKHGAGGVVADADREPALRHRGASNRSIMHDQQLAGAIEEGGAFGGQPHQARRALDQPCREPRLQALEFQADGRLGRAGGLCGAGEALQIRDQHERAHSVDVEGGRSIITDYHH